MEAVQPTVRAVSLSGIQPGEGRRAAEGQGLDQRRRQHVEGRDRRSRSSSRSSASSTSRRSARSSSSSSSRPASTPPTPSRRTSSPASTRAITPAALFGHGGSYSSDIYYSLRLYQTASTEDPGGHLANFSLWKNDEYDALVDELYTTSPTDMEKVMDIWKQGMALWLPDYPDIQISQGIHRLPMNETYWTGLADPGGSVRQPGALAPDLPVVMHRSRRPVSRRKPSSLALIIAIGSGSEPPLPLDGRGSGERLPSPVRSTRCHSPMLSGGSACFSSSSGWRRR